MHTCVHENESKSESEGEHMRGGVSRDGEREGEADSLGIMTGRKVICIRLGIEHKLLVCHWEYPLACRWGVDLCAHSCIHPVKPHLLWPPRLKVMVTVVRGLLRTSFPVSDIHR